MVLLRYFSILATIIAHNYLLLLIYGIPLFSQIRFLYVNFFSLKLGKYINRRLVYTQIREINHNQYNMPLSQQSA